MWPNFRSGLSAPPPPTQGPGGDGGAWTPALSTASQNQWASYYQSVPSQQVDWASLAQQWIALKTDSPGMEGSGYPGHAAMMHHPPAAPPPPLPPSMSAVHHSAPFHTPQAPLPPNMSEGGEANMDLEENGGDVDYESQYTSSQPSFPDVYHSRALPPRQNHIPPHEDFHHHSSDHHHHHHQHAHQPSGYHQHHHNRQHPPSNNWGTGANAEVQGGWGGGSRHGPPIPPLMGASGHAAEYSNMAFSSLNAEARKKLPAWIREGLEKMEREKLKKEEDETRAK